MEKKYTEDYLREAFYKGREQSKLPDENGTIMFLRPTFNGYLRELDGQENPYELWNERVASILKDKDANSNKCSLTDDEKFNLIKNLKEETGWGILVCKRALKESNWKIDGAKSWLIQFRKKSDIFFD